MKQIITLFFALVIMMTTANAQTCPVGLDTIDVNSGNVFTQSWGTSTVNQICGTQRTVDFNGKIIGVGFVAGDATLMRVGIYSDNSNTPQNLLWNSTDFDPAPVGGTSAVDTFYQYLSTPITVTAGQKFWPFMHFSATVNYNLMQNNLSEAGFLRFRRANPSSFTDPLMNPIVMTSGQPLVGQYAVFLLVEFTPQTILSGNASSTSTWLCNYIPANGDSAIVQHEVNWNIDMETNGDTLAWLLVTDSLTMLSGSSIQTKALVDNLGNNFAETVRITKPSGSVKITGTGTSYFEDLFVGADSLFFEKPVHAFNLELESDIYVTTTNLTMQGKINIPSSIYWNSASVTPTFSGEVTINDRFSILNPPGSAQGTWRIQGHPGTGATIGDWDANYGHTSTGYPDSDYPSYDFMSPALYDETVVSTNKDMGWEFPSGDNESLDNRGFFAYYNAGTYTTSWSVTPVVSDFTFSGLTFTESENPLADGWQLLYNPFACAIDLDLVILTNIESQIHTFDHLVPTYTVYDRISGTGTGSRTDSLAAGQAFWVKVGDNPIPASVTIPASAMIKTNDVEYRSGGGQTPVIELRIFEPLGGFGQTPDEDTPWANAFVVPFENGEHVYDSNDTQSWNTNSINGNMTICTTSEDGVHLAHNFIPNDESSILEVWGSSSNPDIFHYIQIDIPEEYSNWCISVKATEGFMGSEPEWIPVVDGQMIGVYTPNMGQDSQNHFLDLRISPIAPTLLVDFTETNFQWEPGQEEVEVNATASGELTNVEWDLGNGNTIEDENNATLVYTQPGTYTVFVTAQSEGCSVSSIPTEITIQCVPMSFEMTNDTIEVTMDQWGYVDIPISFNMGGVELLSWSFNNETGGYYFTYYENGNTHMFDYFQGPSGTYVIQAVVTNDCGEELTDSCTIIVNDFVSVTEHSLPTFSIFPNPNNGENLSIQTKDVGNATIEVFNSIGALVQQERVSSGETKEIYFTQTLASGVYTVRLTSQNGVTAQQFVVR